MTPLALQFALHGSLKRLVAGLYGLGTVLTLIGGALLTVGLLRSALAGTKA